MPGYTNSINNSILGLAAFGTPAPSSTAQVTVAPSISTTDVTTAMLVNPIFSSSSATVYGQILAPAFNPPAGGIHSAVYGLSIAPTMLAGTISSAYGLKVSAIAASSCTVTNAYGLLCEFIKSSFLPSLKVSLVRFVFTTFNLLRPSCYSWSSP